MRLRLHRARGPSGMRAEHLRFWLRASKRRICKWWAGWYRDIYRLPLEHGHTINYDSSIHGLVSGGRAESENEPIQAMVGSSRPGNTGDKGRLCRSGGRGGDGGGKIGRRGRLGWKRMNRKGWYDRITRDVLAEVWWEIDITRHVTH